MGTQTTNGSECHVLSDDDHHLLELRSCLLARLSIPHLWRDKQSRTNSHYYLCRHNRILFSRQCGPTCQSIHVCRSCWSQNLCCHRSGVTHQSELKGWQET